MKRNPKGISNTGAHSKENRTLSRGETPGARGRSSASEEKTSPIPKQLNPHYPSTTPTLKKNCVKHRQDTGKPAWGEHCVHINIPVGMKNSMLKKDLCKVYVHKISRLSNFPGKWILK